MQAAADEMGIVRPTQVIGSTNAQARQLLSLANREGKEFFDMAIKNDGWQSLRKEYVFNTAGVGGLTGNTVSGSAIITNIQPNTTGIMSTWSASLNGLPTTGVTVISVDSSSQVTVSTPVTVTQTAISLAFGQQSYAMPADFDHFITQTFWDRSYRWQLLGPMDPQEWQVLKSGIAPTGPRNRFRIMGDLFYIDPVPASVHTDVFEYISNAWCQSVTGIAQQIWTADTDYYNLDDDAFILGVIWRYRRSKGLDYNEEYNQWAARAQRTAARDGGSRVIPLNAQGGNERLLGPANIPDTSFGS